MEMDKTRLRIAAVEQNDVGALMSLADDTEWYKYSQPDNDHSLLHTAFFSRAIDVFSYLLSIDGFPLNHKNKKGETVLNLCVNLYCLISSNDPYACELIKKGAAVDPRICDGPETLLHRVIKEALVESAKLMIRMGYDVNAQDSAGVTPLYLCVNGSCSQKVAPEILTALLSNGADPNLGKTSHYNAFEYAVRSSSPVVKEALFNYMIDEYTSIDVHIEILLILADERSPFFRGIIDRVDDVHVGMDSVNFHHLLLVINNDDLNILIKKWPEAIRQVYREATPLYHSTCEYCEVMSLENVNSLLESELRDDTIQFIHQFNDQFYFYLLTAFGCQESVVYEYLSFLLSYGLVLDESNLNSYYKRYGFGVLLKLILHTEIQPKLMRNYIKQPHLLLLCDVHCGIDYILENHFRYKNLHTMLYYFCNAELRALCSDDKRAADLLERQPTVPLLVELARTVFRDFLVRTFAVKTASQFYTLVNKLPIAAVQKQIITLERSLY